MGISNTTYINKIDRFTSITSALFYLILKNLDKIKTNPNKDISNTAHSKRDYDAQRYRTFCVVHNVIDSINKNINFLLFLYF